MSKLLRRLSAVVAGVFVSAAALLPGPAHAVAGPVDVQLLALTDLHGYLRPHDDSNGQLTLPDGRTIKVGGAPYIATHLKNLRAGRKNSFLITAGDNFSGWPFEVKAHHDEPTIEFLNAIGVKASAAGNHELDISPSFLTDHMMRGTCFGQVDVDSCFTDSSGRRFHGANFPFYSANIVDKKTGRQLLRPYNIEWVAAGKGRRIPIGFIHLTVPEAPSFAMSFQPGLRGLPLVETANKYAAELKRKGVRAIVVNMHEGATAEGGFNACSKPSGPAVDFARKASADIDAIVTGHWHAGFNCTLPDPAGQPRPVIEGLFHGKLISEIDLKIDPATKDVIRNRTQAINRPVTRDVPPDPAMERMVAYWVKRGEQTYARSFATVTGDITRERNAHGESAFGDLAADVLAEEASRNIPGGADLAVVAPAPPTGATALRGDLRFAKGANPADRDGTVLFGEFTDAFNFLSPVITVRVTGAQIKRALEQQWQQQPDGTVKFAPLAVSASVRYSYDPAKPVGDRISPADVLIGGQPLDPTHTYRLAGLTYTLQGADGYNAFAGFTDPARGTRDLEAFGGYFARHSPLAPPAIGRVTVKS